MKKDIIFLFSHETNWQENFLRAKEVLGNNIKLVDGTSATSIKNAYELMLQQVTSDKFIMIEADNYVLDACWDIQNFHSPVKFWSTNKYGITYEHGGIKIMDTNSTIRQLYTNQNIQEHFEVSGNLQLQSEPLVMSEHRFDWSDKNEWTTIAKELIKLHFCMRDDYISRWTRHAYPKEIYGDVLNIVENVGFSNLFENLLPSLGQVYTNRIKSK